MVQAGLHHQASGQLAAVRGAGPGVVEQVGVGLQAQLPERVLVCLVPLRQVGLPSTAVVAGNDLNAIGVMSTLREAGYRIPEDQAVIGFDDAPEGEQQNPPLSSVDQHIEVVGAEAVRLLVRLLAGEAVAPGHHPVPTSLVVRGSCGCTPDAPVGPALGRAAAVPTDLPPREWLTRTLAETLMGLLAITQQSDVLTAACVTIADAVVDRHRGPRTATELYSAVETIYRHHPRGETIAAVVSTVQELSLIH